MELGVRRGTQQLLKSQGLQTIGAADSGAARGPLQAHPLVLSCVLFALPALAGGCGLLPVGGWPTAARAGNASPMGRGLKEYRAAFHVHSCLSHDSPGTFEEIGAAAASLGLDIVILTDHYEPGNISRSPRGVEHGVLFIPGVELGHDGGSMLSFGLDEDFQKGLPAQALLPELAKKNAVNAVGHVEGLRDWNLEPVSAFEVYNLHAEFKAMSMWGIVWRVLLLPPDTLFESSVREPRDVLRIWDRELLRGRRLAPLAGHDAHANVRVFGPLGGTVGTYEELFRLFSTHILASDLSMQAVRDAVRSGRTFVSFDFVADGTGFSMTYGLGPEPDGIIGDCVAYRREAVLAVSAPPAADDVRIRLLRDGQVILEADSVTLSAVLPGPGIYRAEVFAADSLWIISGPIYLSPPSPCLTP